MKKYKIIFMGTPDFACPTLKSLSENENFIIDLVITQPDKPQGRKKILTPSPVKILANKLGIEVFQPNSLKKDDSTYQKIKSLNPDFIVVVAYGKILPKNILEIPKFGPINIHPSILPKYRGPCPIEAAIVNGEKNTGITIMKMTEGMDEGPVYLTEIVDLQNELNAEEIRSQISNLAGQILCRTLLKIIQKNIQPTDQNSQEATYCQLLTKEDGEINFKNMSAQEIYNKFRGYFPWPGIYFKLKEKTFKVKEMTIIQNSKKIAPEHIEFDKDTILIGTKLGVISIQKLQPDGKQVMAAKDVYNGYKSIFST